MPIGFIILFVLLLYLFMYRNAFAFKKYKLFINIFIILFLFGYFIKPVNFYNVFGVNIIFAFCLFCLAFLTFFKLNIKNKILSLFISLVLIGGYYYLTNLNSDYFTFLNYAPTFIIITLASLLFIYNSYLGSLIITLSFIMLEFSNVFIGNNNVGYLNLFSYDSMNYYILSLLIFNAFTMFFFAISKTKTKIKKYGVIKK